MSLGVLAFLAGVISVLAPCVLPVLPVMLGGGLTARAWYRPLIIGLSTAFFITLFTVLLKVSTAFINVPEGFRVGFSAAIIIVYGLTLVFPVVRERCSMWLGLHRANSLASRAKKREGVWGDVLLGAAFGPIFASCSPTYFILLSLVFPQSIALGITYTLLYSLGFVIFLLIIIYAGRAALQRVSRAVNPNGWFKKSLGILLIVVGVLIATGLMKKLETSLLDSGFWDVTKIEQRLIDNVNLQEMDQENEQACFKSASGVYNCNEGAQQPRGGLDQKDARMKLLNANYAAPDFSGLENWINTSGRDSLAQLRGKVVIIDFWTYSCINCIRTLPYLTKLDDTYADDGLVIIGVHAPEFQFEKKFENVQNAVRKFDIDYPVVQDNDFQTWRNYKNLYRPAKYIIDKNGRVRYTHFGEGKYEETEKVVQYLLGLDEDGVLKEAPKGYTAQQTHETYLGENRRANYSSVPTDIVHEWRLDGERKSASENILLESETGSISINAYASEVNLVLGSDSQSIQATVFVDDQEYKTFQVEAYQLYNLWESATPGKHKIEVKFSEPGVMAYAYTFG